MKFALFSLFLVFSPLFSPMCQAQSSKYKVFINCVFRTTTSTSCTDFKNSFYADYGTFADRVERPEGSDLEMAVTDEPLEAGRVGYLYKWTSHLPGFLDSSFPYPLAISSSLDSLSTLNLLVVNAGKGLGVFLKVTSKVAADDQLVMVYQNPKEAGPNEEKESFENRLAKSPWFVGVGGSGVYVGSGTGSENTSTKSGTGSLEVAYLKDKYKIDVAGSGTYTHQAINSASVGNYTAQDIKSSLSIFGVYSLSKDPLNADKHKGKGVWSIAVINNGNSDSGSNISYQNNTQAGIEWNLVPFRTTQNQELLFAIGPEYTVLNTVQNNNLGHTHEQYWGSFVKVYYYWVLMHSKLTMTLSGAYDENWKYKGRSTLNLSASLNYQITRSVLLTGSATRIISDEESLYYPNLTAQNTSPNPLQYAFQTGQKGGSYVYSIGVSLNLGNVVRKQRDRR